MAPDAATVSENLREAMRFFGRARREGEIRDLPALTVISSGVDYGVFNAAVLCASLNGDVGALSRQMDESADFYRAKNLPWSFWACDDLIGETRGPLRGVLERHSLRHITTAPGMVAEALASPVRALPRMEVREVSDGQTRTAYSHVTAVAFDTPFAACDAVYGAGRGWGGSMRGWVGYQEGRPICTTATIAWAGVIGIYSVGTLPAWQRRGYAEAVMRHAIERTRASAASNGIRS